MEKTADEMFRGLKYEVAAKSEEHIRYVKYIVVKKAVRLTIDVWKNNGCFACVSEVDGRAVPFSGIELLACAQLIREMKSPCTRCEYHNRRWQKCTCCCHNTKLKDCFSEVK